MHNHCMALGRKIVDFGRFRDFAHKSGTEVAVGYMYERKPPLLSSDI